MFDHLLSLGLRMEQDRLRMEQDRVRQHWVSKRRQEEEAKHKALVKKKYMKLYGYA